jgi:hypothetical protein
MLCIFRTTSRHSLELVEVVCYKKPKTTNLENETSVKWSVAAAKSNAVIATSLGHFLVAIAMHWALVPSFLNLVGDIRPLRNMLLRSELIHLYLVGVGLLLVRLTFPWKLVRHDVVLNVLSNSTFRVLSFCTWYTRLFAATKIITLLSAALVVNSIL